MTPTNSEIDDYVDAACNLLHTNKQNVMLLFKPTKYSGQSVKSQLLAQRRIEDRLLTHRVNMDCEVSLGYEVANRHGNDRRPLGGRVQLCYSENSGGECVPKLLQGKGAQGSITDIPLVRTREMRKLQPPGELGDGTGSSNLSPAARLAHRGPAAVQRILESLLEDSGLDSVDCVLEIVELNTSTSGDWAEAAFKLQKKRLSDSKTPMICHLGLARDQSTATGVRSHMEACLMSDWWPLQAEAGPAMPANALAVEKPDLVLASFVEGRPQVSDLVAGKFDEDL